MVYVVTFWEGHHWSFIGEEPATSAEVVGEVLAAARSSLLASELGPYSSEVASYS